jgi:hypothetical protein
MFGASSRHTYVNKNFCICGCGEEIPWKSKNLLKDSSTPDTDDQETIDEMT